MIGVGIIGAGHFGAVHARAMTGVDEVRLVASCRENADAAAAFAAEHGGKSYRDWRALLDDPAVDAVLIATPHHLHEEIAVGAARAGKHILLEKPMAPSVDACDVVLAAANENRIKLMIGHVMHFALPCLKAKEIIDSGILGRPVFGTSWMIKLWMESNRRPWHLDHASGGGMLMTAGIHALDRLIWLMGQPVTRVTAMTGTYFHEQQADDSALIGLRFANGQIGQVTSVGYRNGAVTFAMDLVCEKGMIRIDFDHGVSTGQDGAWTPVSGSIEPNWMDVAVAREWRAFASSITNDTPSPVTGAHGRHIVACIEAAYRASASGCEVPVADAATMQPAPNAQQDAQQVRSSS
ncbi:Gfo/Idh/MocA family protein [Microvirga sp. VF16]|uniref:Gfo/Idh/MocA family protein n=1 Tax=Microvirga sp. VF16 TaxID=2807101 RepID=UPI00193DCE2C|nr:Gfo/Idh/MocA family oxidoreductase [Microvirga sp. VF16]QRM29970.1 Gfo/Idh/MocA family oxidoreductase [Microvirga sp. VF16]